MRIPVAFYVDGFNLYHGINDLGEPFLKWLDLWGMASMIIPSATEELVKVVYCTAFYPGDPQKRWRHEQYLNALRISGVECVEGHYVHENMDCRDCSHTWDKPTEKETDINVALCLFNDGWQGVYNKAYLLSSDSDQAATARQFRHYFKNKKLVSVAPPKRNFSSHILKYADERIALNVNHLESSLFPPIVFEEYKTAGRRPREYDPPEGWVAPKERPQRNP